MNSWEIEKNDADRFLVGGGWNPSSFTITVNFMFTGFVNLSFYY